MDSDLVFLRPILFFAAAVRELPSMNLNWKYRGKKAKTTKKVPVNGQFSENVGQYTQSTNVRSSDEIRVVFRGREKIYVRAAYFFHV